MKYKLIFLFFLVSCSNYSSNVVKKSGHTASGFAYIEQNQSFRFENDDQ